MARALISAALGTLAVLGGVVYRSRRDRPPSRSAVRTQRVVCHDYNVSCTTPCRQCHRLAQEGCTRCSRKQQPRCDGWPGRGWNLSQSVPLRTPLRWLHFPKCGATLAVSIMGYACADSVPSWHVVGMALRGGRIDVRMAHAMRARHASHGTRCAGRLQLPFHGHRPVDPQRDTHGIVAMFRRPSQRIISAYLDVRLLMPHISNATNFVRLTAHPRPPTLAHDPTPSSLTSAAACARHRITMHGAYRQASVRRSRQRHPRSVRLRATRVCVAAWRRCSLAMTARHRSISPTDSFCAPPSACCAPIGSLLSASSSFGTRRSVSSTAARRRIPEPWPLGQLPPRDRLDAAIRHRWFLQRERARRVYRRRGRGDLCRG
jgi:hypothetical protein